MADDGLLLNFDLGDGPLISKPKFQGGSWKDRFIAKKAAHNRIKKFSKPPSDRALFDEDTYKNGAEDYIGPSAEERAPKRQRITVPSTRDVKSTNSTPAQDSIRPAFVSGKLPSGSINTAGSRSVKLQDGTTASPVSKQPRPDAQSHAPQKSRPTVINSRQPPRNTQNDRSQISSKDQGVISSLFSYNPAAKTKIENLEKKAEPSNPSNAPLTDEMATFTALGLSERLAVHLSTKLELKAPTAIQKAAIPEMLKDDSDAFIQAETGSGKTLAYLLPIVQRIMALSERKIKIHRDSGLFAVVLAPTRELCKQIATVLEKLLRCTPWIVGTTVIGGESKQSEKARLRKGVNILIATPGRLADHLDNTMVLDVKSVKWLVLDEGDRLMEMGFEEEIKEIVDKIRRRSLQKTAPHNDLRCLPSRRVTVLCSATMKMNVQRLGEISLKDAVHIRAEPAEEKTESNTSAPENKGFTAPTQLKQAYAVVPAKLRLVALVALLKRTFARRGTVMKAIVFLSCADSVDFHFSLLSRSTSDDISKKAPQVTKTDLTKDSVGYGFAFSNTESFAVLHRLHGSLPQNVRTATLKAFTQSKEPCVMICTDVASRGLDLPNVEYIIEYDPPFSADDHLHRVGRTARAGREGQALIFLLPGNEEGYVPILASSYRDGTKSLKSNTAQELLRKGFGGTGREWEDRATEWQLEVERWALDSPKYLEMARRAFQSHIRAYATHIAGERRIFDMQSLHLGHLAKAFALRDKPGRIKVPGLRPAKMTKADRSVAARKAKRGEQSEEKAPEGERVRKQRKLDLDLPAMDGDDMARRMKRKMKEHMATASEFNIG